MAELYQLLSDTDLQLYLAGALPLRKRVLMKIALIVSPALRGRLQRVHQSRREFLEKDFPILEKQLQPLFDLQSASAKKAESSTSTGNSKRLPFSWKPFPKPILAMACAVILAGGVLLWRPDIFPFFHSSAYTEKGGAMGVSAYLKAKSGGVPRRITGYSARMNTLDTIQVRPVNGEEQSLALFSWDEATGLSAIFPASGESSGLVSDEVLPPGLVHRGRETTFLICVSGQKPFSRAAIADRLSKKPFTPLDKAPNSFLDKEIYFQIYRIEPAR